MFYDEDELEYGGEGPAQADVRHTPVDVRAVWSKQLERGWHGVKVAAWVDHYLTAKLDADIRFLDLLVREVPNFSRVAQRRRRDAVEKLVRDQYLLPWTRKKCPQFFTEERADQPIELTDVEHGFPVAQAKSLVLMALEAGDVEQARKRLVYCWLIPTVNCTNITHRTLPGRCENFDRPLDRYSPRHEKLQDLATHEFQGTPMTLRRFDGAIVDPETYSRTQLLEDLRTIDQLRPIVDGLEGLNFPTLQEEEDYTRKTTSRRTAASSA